MFTIQKLQAGQDPFNTKGVWWRDEKWHIYMTCPKDGAVICLDGWGISRDGIVAPSIFHRKGGGRENPGAECGWHEYVNLENYREPQIIKPEDVGSISGMI